MASADGPAAQGLTPAERVADELVRRFSLSPPVDLRAVTEQYAELEEDFIPGSCDGLVVGLHGPRPRPLILLRKGAHEFRQRFTLAHELGHVLLPWHIGDNLACSTNRSLLQWDIDAYYAASAEAEANRFAAELLVPSTWLRTQIAELGVEPVAPLIEAISCARVSAHVASLRLLEALPAGYVVVVSDGATVLLSGQTQGTGVYPPRVGERLESKRLDRFASHVETVRYGSRSIMWWSFHRPIGVSALGDDPRDDGQVLAALLERHAPDANDAQRIQRTLAGVIGAANSVARREGITGMAELHARFRSRFAKARDLPEEMLDDPEFEIWLQKRAEKLSK